jgi:hypothetical protein
VLDALQCYRLGSAVDPADRAPVTVSHPDPVFVAAQRLSRRMCRERVGGESFDPDEKRTLVTHRNAARSLAAPAETISRTRTSLRAAAKPSTVIDTDGVKERNLGFGNRPSILARADEGIE